MGRNQQSRTGSPARAPQSPRVPTAQLLKPVDNDLGLFIPASSLVPSGTAVGFAPQAELSSLEDEQDDSPPLSAQGGDQGLDEG